MRIERDRGHPDEQVDVAHGLAENQVRDFPDEYRLAEAVAGPVEHDAVSAAELDIGKRQASVDRVMVEDRGEVGVSEFASRMPVVPVIVRTEEIRCPVALFHQRIRLPVPQDVRREPVGVQPGLDFGGCQQVDLAVNLLERLDELVTDQTIAPALNLRGFRASRMSAAAAGRSAGRAAC